jgi:hypothetical protein
MVVGDLERGERFLEAHLWKIFQILGVTVLKSVSFA